MCLKSLVSSLKMPIFARHNFYIMHLISIDNNFSINKKYNETANQ